MTNTMPWSHDNALLRLNQVIDRVNANEAALDNIYTQTFFGDAIAHAKQLSSLAESPLSGALVSIKDLFDVEGYVTKAGTQFMADDPPAHADAPPIKHLRDAGAILTGHTNMTELAYSGLGLNPHYGTPENAIMPGRIPGGSTTGGAVSVAQGVADIAIGTDTGGSVRIPAAFNGIVGFKPSQKTVSRNGCKALSKSLDSIGPLARSVAACDLAYRVMSDGAADSGLEVERQCIIPTNFGMDDLDHEVEDAFEQAIALIVSNGYKVEHK